MQHLKTTNRHYAWYGLGIKMVENGKIKFIDKIHDCPLCSSPVCEMPLGSGKLACIMWNCPYMTHYGNKFEDYIFVDGEWRVK